MKFDEYEVLDIKLYDHQVETIRFVLNNPRCFIMDDIGTGKTLTSIALTDFLMINKKICRVLVVCPLSVLEATWVKHIYRYFPHRKFQVLHGPKPKRIERLNKEADYYLINTDGIKVIEKELSNKKFDVIIIDESTTFASHKTDRTKCMFRLTKPKTVVRKCNGGEVKKINIPRSVICMSGDPIPNDTLQSFSQARIVNPDTAPRYFTRFRDEIKYKLDMYNYVDKENAVQIAHSILQPAIRHKLEDCMDMPPIVFEERDIQLTKAQQYHYNMMEKEYIALINNGIVTASNAAVKAIKLRQISAGLIIDDEGVGSSIDHKYRLKELQYIYDQLGIKKLVVFASFTASVNALLEHFKGKARKIDGSVKSRERANIIKDFQEGDLEIIIGQPKAISHGVDLFASRMIVWWDPPVSNEAYKQCNGRIRRSGQTRPQLVIKFQSTKVDKKIYRALARKQNVSKALLRMV